MLRPMSLARSRASSATLRRTLLRSSGRALLPALEGALRGGQRAVEVLAAWRAAAWRSPGCVAGFDDVLLLLAAAAVDEFAVDVEAELVGYVALRSVLSGG
jgi:hypothetical protein